MKKISLSLFIVALFVFSPIFTQASVADDLRAQISALLAQVEQLQKDLVEVEKGTPTTPSETIPTEVSPTVTTTTNTGTVCPLITRSLKRGIRGQDVRELQKYLRSTGDFTFSTETDYYGRVTEEAVQKWQKRNGVVSQGKPSSTGFGVFGPKTRTVYGKMCGRNTTTNTQSIICPAYVPSCKDGQHIETGPKTSNGCATYICVDDKVTPPPICPAYVPFCKDGQHIETGPKTSNGCYTYLCVDDKAVTPPIQCPLYSPPLCEKGQHVETGPKDADGCAGAPVCVDDTTPFTCLPQILPTCEKDQSVEKYLDVNDCTKYKCI